MKCLLDTHTYLWARNSPQVLPARVLHLLADPFCDATISIVTPWEIAIKVGRGKLDAASLLINFELRELSAGYRIAAITAEQVIQSGLLPSHHRDPFDRLLLAQAFDLRIPILSNDDTFDFYGISRIWD